MGRRSLGSAFIDGNGVASITISSLRAGEHMITAVYNGDVADGISTSTLLTQTITALPPGPATPDGDHTPFVITGTAMNTAPVVAHPPILTPSATGAKRPSDDWSGTGGGHAPSIADVDALWPIWMAADRRTEPVWSLGLTER